MRNRNQGVNVAHPALEGENGFSLISNETLTRLYTNLLKCRMLEKHLRGIAKQGRRGANSAAGGLWEVAAVGVAMDLVPEDTVRSTGRETVTAYLCGASLETVLGSSSGEVKPETGSSALLHSALGAALANKTRKNGKVAVVFWREGASDGLGDALEAARAHALPMIFVRNADRSGGRKLGKRRSALHKSTWSTDALELPAITVDGADVVAVYRVAHESIDRARRRRGPTLIECDVFSVYGNGKIEDPIANMENYLRGKGLFGRELKTKIVEDFARELDAALDLAGKTPGP